MINSMKTSTEQSKGWDSQFWQFIFVLSITAMHGSNLHKKQFTKEVNVATENDVWRKNDVFIASEGEKVKIF